LSLTSLRRVEPLEMPERLVVFIRPTEVLLMPERGPWVIRLEIVDGMNRHECLELAQEIAARWERGK